jgi:hypothetical protein
MLRHLWTVTGMPWSADLAALERRFRQRLLVLYVVGVTVLLITVGTFQVIGSQREASNRAFQRQITGVCYTTQENAVNLNSAVDQLITAVQTSRTLTATEKQQRILFYRQIRSKVPACPPR